MSTPAPRVDLLILWHHHQPDYRSPREGRALLPWVALHASKDYVDMALHLKRHPGVRATFNFVPSLLDQLDDFAGGGPETLFELLARPVEELIGAERIELLSRCLLGPSHAFERMPEYRRLVERVRRSLAGGGGETLGEDDVLKLEIGFLLAWIDPTLLDEPEAAAAGANDSSTTATDLVARRDGLIALHRRLSGRVVPEYAALARSGQIELSASPYYHPILPLIIGTTAARRARPDLPLPITPFAAPEDAEYQVRRALDRHAGAFGMPPLGMWPAEGSVSPEAAEMFAQCGVRWIASDEGILWNSLAPGERRRELLYRPWRFDTPSGSVVLFFRDHELSDRIGFVYQHWAADQAAADFVERLRRIGREHSGAGTPLVAVILDGENCWENYAEDGGPFLESLYRALESAPDIRTVTPRMVLEERPDLGLLPRLHSGSWIDADFRLWIGHPEKNSAWELLARTRRDLASAGDRAAHPEAWESLGRAEGSDWFWWFGDDHFTSDKALFDRLFREHLQATYELRGRPVPTSLMVPVANPVAGKDGGEPLGLIQPRIDGVSSEFYEWHGAVRLGANGGGSMHRGPAIAREVWFGFDLENLYVRVDFTGELPGADVDFALELVSPVAVVVRVPGLEPGERSVLRVDAQGEQPVPGAECRIAKLLELKLPFRELGVTAGQSVEWIGQLRRGGQLIETVPAERVRFEVPDDSFEASMWTA